MHPIPKEPSAMKRVFSVLFQFLLFFLVFAVGSFVPPFHLERQLAVTPDGTRVFVCDGLVLMVVLFALILAIQAMRNHIRAAAPWTALAFVLAAVAGFAAKLGFLTR
jgi:hypothetical protein